METCETPIEAAPVRRDPDDRGATVLEYSILAALIVGGIIAVVVLLPEDFRALLETVTTAV